MPTSDTTQTQQPPAPRRRPNCECPEIDHVIWHDECKGDWSA